MNYKKYLVLFALIIITILLGIFISTKNNSINLLRANNNQSTIASNKTVTILMKPDVFEPSTLEIKKGTTVIFKNEDTKSRWPASNLHPTHELYPEFDPKEPVDPGKNWQFTFDKIGNWQFHDHLSPYIRGIIKVVE